MNEMKRQLPTKNVPHSTFHIWFMTLIISIMMLLALSTAIRLPLYLASGDLVRLVGTIFFNLVAVVGLIDNVHTHFIFWQKQNHLVTNQPEIAAQN